MLTRAHISQTSVLISSDSEMFQFWFSAVHNLKISKDRWKQKFNENEWKMCAEQPCFNPDLALI